MSTSVHSLTVTPQKKRSQLRPHDSKDTMRLNTDLLSTTRLNSDIYSPQLQVSEQVVVHRNRKNNEVTQSKDSKITDTPCESLYPQNMNSKSIPYQTQSSRQKQHTASIYKVVNQVKAELTTFQELKPRLFNMRAS